MERRVHLQSESQRTQACVTGIWRESINAWRFSRNGWNTIGQFAQRTGKSCNRTQKLSAATQKVSWVCLIICLVFFYLLLFCSVPFYQIQRNTKLSKFILLILKRITRWIYHCMTFFFWIHFILSVRSFNLNVTIFFLSFYSARSRVRGTLEVYHAFIRDLDASDTSSSTNNEPDWELVNDGETEPDVEAVANAQVCGRLAWI